MSDDYSNFRLTLVLSPAFPSMSRQIPVIQNKDDRPYIYKHSAAAGSATSSGNAFDILMFLT
jgi:hypothetical protein